MAKRTSAGAAPTVYVVDGQSYRVAFSRRCYGPGAIYTWVNLVGQLPLAPEYGGGEIWASAGDPFPKVRPSRAEVEDSIRAFVAHNNAI